MHEKIRGKKFAIGELKTAVAEGNVKTMRDNFRTNATK